MLSADVTLARRTRTPDTCVVRQRNHLGDPQNWINHVMGEIPPPFPWQMISALAACTAIVVSLWYYSRNLALTRLSNSARMVMDLVAKFEGKEMREYRQLFATELLSGTKLDLLGHVPVLEFFEEIGYMTKRGVLDTGMVWNSFFWWLAPYYEQSERSIKIAREHLQSRVYFREIEWLYKELCKVASKEQGHKYYLPRSPEFNAQFLKHEQAIGSLSLPASPSEVPGPAGADAGKRSLRP
jgi:hypothetical protein